MKYVWWGLGGLAVLVTIVALVCLFYRCRRKQAVKQVCRESEEEKACRLNSALSLFGFSWCKNCGCITTGRNPWQREMGYCAQYDRAAPAMGIIMDYEPIYFRYDDRDWLLEFWKGQYGCATGAEIGLYYNDEKTDRPPEKLFYTCAEDSESLQMYFSLWKDGKCILERNERCWWLTGFLPGMYSEPENLVMKVCIFFCDRAMQEAFYRGLLRAGYSRRDIRVKDNRVCLTFGRPKTEQVSRFGRFYRSLVCRKNAMYCRWYLRASRPFCSTLDRISFLCCCFPRLYRMLIRLGMSCSRRKYARCRRRG